MPENLDNLNALIVIALVIACLIGLWYFLVRHRPRKDRRGPKPRNLADYRREKPRSPPGGTPGLALAVLLLAAPALAQSAVARSVETNPCGWFPGDSTAECAAFGRGGASGLQTAEATTEAVRPGVGWTSAAGRIDYARGTCAGQTYAIQLHRDPWIAIGDPDAQTRPLDTDAVFRRLFFLRYDRHEDGRCERGGVGGVSPHGATVEGRLKLWYAQQPESHWAQWTGVPNHREIQDVAHSSSEWCRLNTAVGIACGGGGSDTCGNGWRCTPLIDLPENERVGAPRPGGGTVRVRRDNTTGNSEACSFFATVQGWLWVRNQRPECFEGLAAGCTSAATLTASCWQPQTPQPVCGDGTCTPPESRATCPSDCPPVCGDGQCEGGETTASCAADCPPAPTEAVIEVLGCEADAWSILVRGVAQTITAPGVVTVDGVSVALPACSSSPTLFRIEAIEWTAPTWKFSFSSPPELTVTSRPGRDDASVSVGADRLEITAPAAPAVACPRVESLEQLRAVPGVCQ